MPVLVAPVEDDEERDFLEGVARVGGITHVQLLAPPMDRSLHALEVSAPSRPDPLVLLARPEGPPTADGYTLRLSLNIDPRSHAEPRPPSVPPKKRRPTTRHKLSEHHTRDLERDDSEEPASNKLGGRAIAGGKLLIEARVGAGGAGAVYRARHRDLNMPVAVKVMRDRYQRDVDYCRRFHAEALSASRLDHPNLTRVFDYGQESDGLLYIAMEFLDGKSVRRILDDEKKVAPRRAASLIVQVCTGLVHAHARNIIHRDIKPENLMVVRGLDDDGNDIEVVKVCDFGIAHAGAAEGSELAGTPEYMPLEQCLGQPTDARADVYACGVVLYELITGEVPLGGGAFGQTLLRKQTEEPDAPSRRVPGLDPRFDRLLLRALARSPTARHQTIRELRTDLREILGFDPRTTNTATAVPAFDPQSLDVQRHPAPHERPSRTRSASDPDWLERGGGYIAPPVSSATTSAPARQGPEPSRPPPTQREVAAWMREIAQTTDPMMFAALVPRIESKVHALAERGEAGALSALATALEVVATEGPPLPKSRAGRARELLRLFKDPQLLGPIADKVLDRVRDADGMASKTLVSAGTAGAYALYSALLKNRSLEARKRFAGVIDTMGAHALPMLRAALDRLAPRVLAAPAGPSRPTPRVPTPMPPREAVELAEDLLKAIPKHADDAMGELLARYTRCPVPAVATLATKALPRVWGQRASAMLVGLLGHASDDIWAAAVGALHELGAIDTYVVRRLGPLVTNRASTRRLVAVDALAHPTADALGVARAVLAQAFAGTAGPPPDSEDAVVAIARALLAVGGAGAVIAERCAAAPPRLRTRLQTLLRVGAS
jgi:serine/threonine-protein kinase